MVSELRALRLKSRDLQLTKLLLIFEKEGLWLMAFLLVAILCWALRVASIVRATSLFRQIVLTVSRAQRFFEALDTCLSHVVQPFMLLMDQAIL